MPPGTRFRVRELAAHLRRIHYSANPPIRLRSSASPQPRIHATDRRASHDADSQESHPPLENVPPQFEPGPRRVRAGATPRRGPPRHRMPRGTCWLRVTARCSCSLPARSDGRRDCCRSGGSVRPAPHDRVSIPVSRRSGERGRVDRLTGTAAACAASPWIAARRAEPRLPSRPTSLHGAGVKPAARA